MRRLPIRVRVAAAFALAMTIVLAGTGVLRCECTAPRIAGRYPERPSEKAWRLVPYTIPW